MTIRHSVLVTYPPPLPLSDALRSKRGWKNVSQNINKTFQQTKTQSIVLFTATAMGNCISSHSFLVNDTVPGQTITVLNTALELGYERSDIDRMFRWRRFFILHYDCLTFNINFIQLKNFLPRNIPWRILLEECSSWLLLL